MDLSHNKNDNVENARITIDPCDQDEGYHSHIGKALVNGVGDACEASSLCAPFEIIGSAVSYNCTRITLAPTNSPAPSVYPSNSPTLSPSLTPSAAPTLKPTIANPIKKMTDSEIILVGVIFGLLIIVWVMGLILRTIYRRTTGSALSAANTTGNPLAPVLASQIEKPAPFVDPNQFTGVQLGNLGPIGPPPSYSSAAMGPNKNMV